MPAVRAKPLARDPKAWCYVSGRVSALEGRLLSHRATLDLIAASSLDDLLARVRQTLIFGNLSEGTEPLALAESLEAAYADFVRQIAAASPTGAVAGLFLLPIEWRAFRAHLRAAALGQEQVATPGAAVPQSVWAACWQAAAVEPAFQDFAAAAAAVRAATQLDERDEHAVEQLTSVHEARCLLHAAQDTGSADILRWVLAELRLRAALSLLRARLNGFPREPVEAALALLGAERQDIAQLASAEHRDWRPALARLGLPAAQDLPEEEQLPAPAIERLMDEAVLRLSRSGRGIPFGPEPVYAFLCGLRTEARNLRLIVAGIAAGLPAEAIVKDIRQPYA